MTKADKFREYINGRNVTVIGIGISNLPLIKYLVKAGAEVTACDVHDAQWLGDNYRECEKLGVKTCLGEDYLENLTDDLIFKTPGMRYDIPQLTEAKNRGAVITSSPITKNALEVPISSTYLCSAASSQSTSLQLYLMAS